MGCRSRILVIDDDPMFRSLLVSLLRHDFFVSVASDGESGYEKGCEHRPDLVIIDFNMPGWDGITTLKAFRENSQFANTKKMMLTGDATKDTVMAAIHAGVDGYIIKTAFNKTAFLEKVNSLLATMVAKPVPRSSTAAGSQQYGATKSGNSGSSNIPVAKSTSIPPQSAKKSDSDQGVSEKVDSDNRLSDEEAKNLESMMDDWE